MYDEIIKIELTEPQRKLLLIVKDDILDKELESLVSLPIKKGNKYILNLPEDLLDDLCGYVGFMANHTDDNKLQKQLDRLCSYLNECLDNEWE